MLNFFGVEISTSLEDSEGKHRGDNEFVLFKETSSGEMEGNH